MKISLNWLSEFVDLPTRDPEELRTVLAALGHEVDGVERVDVGWSGVTIAEVLTVEAHPNADKVRLCSVTTGGEPIQVVCGAWNFEAGALVAFANPGAVLPGGFEIGSREIRGVMSHGMICSERELGLGEDHAGILVLEPDAPVGEDFGEWVALPDVVFDLTITPNRPDAMSVLGIARDLAAHYSLAVTMPPTVADTVPGAPEIEVDIEDPTGCFRFVTREVRRARIGPSPFWMRHRLRLAGMRAISTAVDVTNYVMLELGHPLHAFDRDRIAGGRLTVRRAEAGETLTTLDDVERELTSDDLVISDADGPTSLAGTMGGARSEVTPGTTRILLEAASWDPPTVMWMSRRHGLRSEASARFERGVDRELPPFALARAAALLQQVAGGEVLDGVNDAIAAPFTRRELSLSMSEVERVLGPGFDPARVGTILSSLGFGVSGSDPMAVTVPGFRPDVERPIDLIEELARMAGYDSFGSSVPTGRGRGWTTQQRRTRLLRNVLVGAGLYQATHLSFISAEDLDILGYPSDHPARKVVVVRNPLREEEANLRTTLLPGLLRSARYNLSHGASAIALFETGKVFFDRPDPSDPRIPHQPDRVAFVLVGSYGDREMGSRPRPVDLHAAIAVWDRVAEALELDAKLEQVEAPSLHPGRGAAILIEGERVGYIGELHPGAAEAYELSGRVAVAEVDLEPLVGPRPRRTLKSPSTYPPVEFDLAFKVDALAPADSLVAATSAPGGGLIESAVVFDEYTGLEDGRKSLAIRYVLRAADHTLTNEEVAPIRQAMVEAAATVGAELRGAS